jgi:hypothetical protein
MSVHFKQFAFVSLTILATCVPIADAFGQDDLLMQSAKQRLQQNGMAFDMMSPYLNAGSSSYTMDICMKCRCCEITGNGFKVNLKQLQSLDSLTSVNGEFVLAPKAELVEIMSRFAKRSGQDDSGFSIKANQSRVDICRLIKTCSEAQTIDLNSLKGLDDQRLQTLQDNVAIIPEQEFKAYMDKAFK